MTIEYILLVIVVFMTSLKFFLSAPREAFMKSGPRLGARVEKHLATGRPFALNHGVQWDADKKK